MSFPFLGSIHAQVMVYMYFSSALKMVCKVMCVFNFLDLHAQVVVLLCMYCSAL